VPALLLDQANRLADPIKSHSGGSMIMNLRLHSSGTALADIVATGALDPALPSPPRLCPCDVAGNGAAPTVPFDKVTNTCS